MKRQNWILLGAIVLWGSVMLADNSDGLSIIGYPLYIFGGLLFGSLTIGTGVILVESGLKKHELISRIFPATFMLQVIFLAVIYFGVSHNLSIIARFELSRSAFDSTVAEVQSGKLPTTPRRLGLFHVSEIERDGKLVWFNIGKDSLYDAGVVYSQMGRPNVGLGFYQHIKGPWWFWIDSW